MVEQQGEDNKGSGRGARDGSARRRRGLLLQRIRGYRVRKFRKHHMKRPQPAGMTLAWHSAQAAVPPVVAQPRVEVPPGRDGQAGAEGGATRSDQHPSRGMNGRLHSRMTAP